MSREIAGHHQHCHQPWGTSGYLPYLHGSQVVQPLLDTCLKNPEKVVSLEVTDNQAKEAVVKVCYQSSHVFMFGQFATDHRLLVEPACGAVLASVYRCDTFIAIHPPFQRLAAPPSPGAHCGGRLWRKPSHPRPCTRVG